MSATGTPKIVSPYGRADDEFGYAVYSVVVMASLQQQAEIDLLRKALQCQRSMLPAHVTVKGTFCEIPGLDEVIGIVRDVAAETSPFRVRFSGPPDPCTRGDGHKVAFQWIEKTPELVELHNCLYDAIAPVTTNAYGNELGDAYHPHLTLYHEPLPALEYRAPDLLHNLQLGDGFNCDNMLLMGHIGPPYRGRWTVVREFVFGG